MVGKRADAGMHVDARKTKFVRAEHVVTAEITTDAKAFMPNC